MMTVCVTLSDVIDAIAKKQAVLNKEQLQAHKALALQGVASLDKAQANQLSFLADKKYVQDLEQTQAGAVLVSPKSAANVPASCAAVIVDAPYLAYASVSSLFDNQQLDRQLPQIHPTALIHDEAVLGDNVTVGAYASIGRHAVIGANTCIGSHVAIESGVHIGKNCVLKSHVVVAHDCVIGDDTRIHAHASIGSEGFGFAPTANPATQGWERIVQLGRVIIGNGVRIGSHTCVDRGAIEDTVIEDNVIIDNLVQVAHNVHIGAGTAIAAKTGIAGSTLIGKRCMIGGAVGITGHLSICDDVTLTAMTMVTKSIKVSGTYSSGTSAMPSAEWRRAAVKFRQSGSH